METATAKNKKAGSVYLADGARKAYTFAAKEGREV